MAELFRLRLADAGCDVVIPEKRATLVSWRVPADESADVVARLAEAGVIVRDLPGRGLVRASVGWWNDESDLERLIAAL
jgi:L-cysteine/cystine lyase